MDAPVANSCPNCERLERLVAALQAEVVALRAEVAALQAQLAASKKNSSNSSKPPSSDIGKPAGPAAKPSGRKRGGQAGHPRHVRPAFEPPDIDVTILHELSICPDCGGKTRPVDDPPRVLQQVELAKKLVTVTEHQGQACFCKRCRKTHYAPIPEPAKRAGLVGPRLSTLVAFLKGGCHCSFSTIRKFLRDVACFQISNGQLRKVCSKVADSLNVAYDALRAALIDEPVLNVDETGHKEYKQRLWTWCFRAANHTLFKIDPSRGSEVLIDVLGTEFAGVLGCDYFSAYRKFMGDFDVRVQFCLAHLLRDLKFLAEHPDRRNRTYGKRLLKHVQEMFGVIHRRGEYRSAKAFQQALQDAGDEVLANALHAVPAARESQNMAQRFHEHGESYLRFISTPGIEPTNNLAERAIRFVVIDRLVTQGSRSEGGRRWLERIWTTMATCAQQGRSAFQFLIETVTAHLAGQPAPSLLPDSG